MDVWVPGRGDGQEASEESRKMEAMGMKCTGRWDASRSDMSDVERGAVMSCRCWRACVISWRLAAGGRGGTSRKCPN